MWENERTPTSLTEQRDVSDAEFIINGGRHLITFVRHGLSGPLNYRERKPIEKRFQRVTIQTDRFHTFWSESLTPVAGYNRFDITTIMTGRNKR